MHACCNFLEQQLDPANAIGIADFAEQHGCTKLYQKANEFILQHFRQICQEEEFLRLSAMQLSNMKSNYHYNISHMFSKF